MNNVVNHTVDKCIVITDHANTYSDENILLSLVWNRCLHSVSETLLHCQADHGVNMADLVKKHSKRGLLIPLYCESKVIRTADALRTACGRSNN